MRLFMIFVLDLIALVCIVLQKPICMQFSEIPYLKNLLDIGSGFLLSIALGFSIYCTTIWKPKKQQMHTFAFRITILHSIGLCFYYIYLFWV